MPDSTITTATGLDALPAQTVGRWNENGGCVWEKHVSGRWRSPSDSRPYSAEGVARYPLTLLYRPDAEPGTDRLDVQTAMAYGLGVEDGQRESARTEPTEEHVARVTDVLNRFLLGEGWHERRIAENMARAVLALVPPQRCAPSRERLAQEVGQALHDGGDWAHHAADAIRALYAAQPTVEEAKAQGALEVIAAVKGYMIEPGVNDGCPLDLWLDDLAHPYRSGANHA